MTPLDVWVVELDPTASGAEPPGPVTEVERAAAARLRRTADRQRFLVGRAALRAILGRLLDVPPAQVAFDTGPQGKLRLPAGSGLDLRFNVSHSGRFVLVAVSERRDVGVDIEAVAGSLAGDPVVRGCFAELDRVMLAEGETVPGGDRYAVWVRKEAVLKAAGCGLAGDPRQVPVVGPDGRFLDQVGRYAVTGLEIDPGYAAAAAVEGTAPVLLTLSAL